ncbi:MAG TPA: hypothetical protein VGL66_11995 [Caulobacteraceae bacterium]|jgi:hypothetical protein
MHIHLPKPLHGWRAFVGEVGIIVLGVLIALGAESVVESFHWRHKVEVVRRSLMGELANDRARWDVDLVAARCAHQDMLALDAWLKGGGAGVQPMARNIRPENLFWMHSANWNLATGSQTLDHFPMDEQLAFAALYDGVAHRQRDLQRAHDTMTHVQALTPLATDAQGRRELSVALRDMDGELYAVVANNGYMQRHFKALGVKTDSSDIAADLAVARCVS